MSQDTDVKPWEVLEQLIQADDTDSIRTQLERLSSSERLLAFTRMDRERRAQLLRRLDPEFVASLLEVIPESQAAGFIEELKPKLAGAILEEMRSDHRADLLAKLDESGADAIVGELSQQAADEVRQLVQYPPDTAGGLMGTEYIAFPEQLRVSDLLDHLREKGERYSDYTVQYAYIINNEGLLTGILPLRDLLFASRGKTLAQIMIPDPHCLDVRDSIEKISSFFDRHHFVGAPVIDDERRLVGVVRRAFVERAGRKASSSIFMRFGGIIGGEELRTMPLWVRSSRRMAFLSPNIILNFLAASVIAYYQDTLAAVIALAFFLPMISDMCGCSGNQAVAVSIRELSLGLIRARELMRVLGKESLLGLINGTMLGVLLGAVAWVWIGNPLIGFIVGFAMALNTLVSVTVGGSLPLVLRRLRVDPALVSSPILTTVTDMCGFFLVLGSASALLPLLTSN